MTRLASRCQRCFYSHHCLTVPPNMHTHDSESVRFHRLIIIPNNWCQSVARNHPPHHILHYTHSRAALSALATQQPTHPFKTALVLSVPTGTAYWNHNLKTLIPRIITSRN